jgi:hypothetical protein
MIEAKLLSTLGSTVVALILAGIAWLVALLVQQLFNRPVGSPRYYSVIVVLGFALSHEVPTIRPAPRQDVVYRADTSPPGPSEGVGLDAPFIPPKEAEAEKFPGQLERSLHALSPAERTTATEAIAFLSYSVIADPAEKDPTSVDTLSESDLAATVLLRLYRLAQRSGGSMTFRKYVDLAEELKSQKPQWWQQYVTSVKQ